MVCLGLAFVFPLKATKKGYPQRRHTHFRFTDRNHRQSSGLSVLLLLLLLVCFLKKKKKKKKKLVGYSLRHFWGVDLRQRVSCSLPLSSALELGSLNLTPQDVFFYSGLVMACASDARRRSGQRSPSRFFSVHASYVFLQKGHKNMGQSQASIIRLRLAPFFNAPYISIVVTVRWGRGGRRKLRTCSLVFDRKDGQWQAALTVLQDMQELAAHIRLVAKVTCDRCAESRCWERTYGFPERKP